MNRVALFLHRCFRKFANFVSSISELSVRGINIKRRSRYEVRSLAAEQAILTPHDCSLILDINEDEIIALLLSGHLAGLLIGKRWRVQPEDLMKFIASRREETRLAQIQAAIEDPTAWARVCWQDEENAHRILAEEHEEGTFGKFLQDALQDHPPSEGE